MPPWMIRNMMFIKPFIMRLKMILAEPKKTIIRILSEGDKNTNELYIFLQEQGFKIAKSTLYYHLSTLEDLGIIEMVGYREKGGGAPEKVWHLKIRKIGIDLVTGEIFEE